MSELRFDEQVVVITGAGQGLGRSHALRMAERGARVVVNDPGGAVDGSGTSDSPAQQVVDEIKEAGGEAVANFDSVATQAGARAVIDTATSTYGRVDVLVNNAGILRDKSFKKMTPEEYEAVINVHLYGTVWCSMAAWPVMQSQGYGRIINTASAAGLFGNFGQTNYGAAKAGIAGFSLTLAQEGAKANIRTNVIAPSARTRMTEGLLGPLAEKLDPKYVTPVVMYLAHRECEVNGEIYSCGGGRVGRIFIASIPGFYSDELTAEDVRDNLAQIRDPADFRIPTAAFEEVGMLADMAK